MTRYARKVDTNHRTLTGQLRAVPGMRVKDTSAMSGLGADLIVFWQNAPPLFLEIKSGAKQPLTDSERQLKALAGSYWARVTCIEDVFVALGISTEPAPDAYPVYLPRIDRAELECYP